jgi:hypothetical protein
MRTSHCESRRAWVGVGGLAKLPRNTPKDLNSSAEVLRKESCSLPLLNRPRYRAMDVGTTTLCCLAYGNIYDEHDMRGNR